jgi:uncharacterized membrane-anchored protein YhcB (DUF1043 family)
MNDLAAMGIMIWMYAVVIVCFGYVIGRLVCECCNLMHKRNRRTSKEEIAKRQAKRYAGLLRNGIVADVTWMEV